MRVTPSLSIPDRLELARSNSELVVFAGAGVSMSPPANMPGFVDLAKYIAEPVVRFDPQRYETRLDEYLGEALRRDVRVHERARDRLDPGGRSHNPMHEHLVGLFGTAERVRLITTNFEEFFTTAADVVYPGVRIPHYYGPALPPGSDFAGIAHLHGARKLPESKLVLTDEDFARAYLSNGWATRFLIEVFAGRTVLFVGYSLGDPVIQYVLRAIAPTGRWYALVHEEEEHSRWQGRGIELLTFATSTTGQKFGELRDGIARWRWYAQAPEIDHDKELRRVLDGGPTDSPLDADYLRARLQTEPGRETFWNAAKSAPWLEWAANEGYLNSLSDPTRSDLQLHRWAYWCLNNFVRGDDPPLLRLLRRRGLVLHPLFARLLTTELCQAGALAARPAVRQFVALIASNPAAQRGDEDVWLLKGLIGVGYAAEALALLRANTNVRLGPLEHYYFGLEDDEHAVEGRVLPALSRRVVLSGDASDIAYELERTGAELAKLAPAELLALGVRQTSEAYDLLDLARASDDDQSFDWLSYGRTSIAPSNQDHGRHAEDALVLIVRIALDELSLSAPESVQRFVEAHSGGRRALLQRLALYGLSKLPNAAADDVLDCGRAEGWARQVLLRPELYLVLRAHFPRATEAARERFIKALQDDGSWGADFDEHDAHARFSLSQMLSRAAPDSAATSEFAATEKAAHPKWGEGDRDGLLSRVEVGWGGDGPSPIDAEEMVQWTPEEAVQRLSQQLEGPDVVE